MDWLAILSLVLFVALTVAFLGFLRRASRLVGRIRDHETAQKEVADLERRIATAIDPLLDRIEDVRHHRAGAQGLETLLPEASSAVGALRRDVKALKLPVAFTAVLAGLPDALEKAERAIALIEHGATALANARGGPRELEGQTSLKRGALALRNARAEAGDVTRRAAEIPIPQATRRLGGPETSRHPAPPRTPYQVVTPPPPTLLAPAARSGGPDSAEPPSDPAI